MKITAHVFDHFTQHPLNLRKKDPEPPKEFVTHAQDGTNPLLALAQLMVEPAFCTAFWNQHEFHAHCEMTPQMWRDVWRRGDEAHARFVAFKKERGIPDRDNTEVSFVGV